MSSKDSASALRPSATMRFALSRLEVSRLPMLPSGKWPGDKITSLSRSKPDEAYATAAFEPMLCPATNHALGTFRTQLAHLLLDFLERCRIVGVVQPTAGP